MPLFSIKDLEQGNTKLGVWKITESANKLLPLLTLQKEEIETYDRFSNENRKKQWIASRLILAELFKDNKISITYKDNGKPHLSCGERNISISHTAEFVAVIVSSNAQLGIDIEKIQPRILRVRHKFVSEAESKFIDESSSLLEQLYVIWSAKETLYKLHGIGNLDFRTNLNIEPFSFQGNGCAYAQISTHKSTTKYKLKYEQIEDHLLVYVIDPI